MTFAEAFNPIRALKSTFEAMNLQPGHLWGGALLLIFVESITGIGFQFIGPVAAGGGEQAVVFLFCGACVAAVGFFALATWLMSGLFLTFRSVIQTGELTEQGLFDHQGKFFPLLLTRLLVVVCSIVLMIPGAILMGLVAALVVLVAPVNPDDGVYGAIGIAVMIIGGLASYAFMIYCVIGVVLAESAVIFEDLTPTEAIKRSWSLASGHRWRLVLFFLVNGIFAILGLLLCCVGVLATSAITRLATAEAYLQCTSGEEVISGDAAADDDERAVRLD